MFTVNLSKAKEAHKERIRAQRKLVLADLDIEFIRALETNDQTKINIIVTKKEALRNITNVIDAATTLEEVLSITCESVLS